MAGVAAALFAGIGSTSTDWLVKPTGLEVLGAPVGIARDPHGRPAILVPAPGRPAELKLLTRGLTARIGALASGPDNYADWLMVTCEDRTLRSTFFSLCDDVLDQLGQLDAAADPVTEAMTIVHRWKALMEGVGSGLLSESQCAGLLAELHAMEELATRYGADVALSAWVGPDRSRVDFRFQNAGLEVKATLQREQFRVTVHGLLQLDDTEVGSLRLWAQQLEAVPAGGDSIPDAVARLVGLGVDVVALTSELAKVGCLPADEDEYRAVRFKVLDERGVQVGPGTPRIVPASFVDSATSEVLSAVSYQLDLTALTESAGRLTDARSAFEGLDR